MQQQSNNFIRASVTNPPPELKIKFDNVEIPSEQILKLQPVKQKGNLTLKQEMETTRPMHLQPSSSV